MNPRACVIGWPVEHSRSPLLHRYWLDALGLPGSYERAAVPPEDLVAFLRDLGQHGYVGANVTLPHKARAFALCDETTAAARQLGAVNTLWLDAGKLYGDNTDVAGFLGALDQDAEGWDDAEQAVVIGAGGAARAVICALMLRNIRHIAVLNRTRARVQDLIDLFGKSITAHGFDEAPELLRRCDLLVNSSSLGMVGQEPLQLDLAPLPAHAVVDDIVYVPLETPLMGAARARGLRTVGGLPMLLHQGVSGFERWFGRRPAVTAALRARVAADIEARP